MKLLASAILFSIGLYVLYVVFYLRPQMLPLYEGVSTELLSPLKVMTTTGFILYILGGIICLLCSIILFIKYRKSK